MAATASAMFERGTPVPDFRLADYEGKRVSRDDFRNAEALLVAFLCHH